MYRGHEIPFTILCGHVGGTGTAASLNPQLRGSSGRRQMDGKFHVIQTDGLSLRALRSSHSAPEDPLMLIVGS